MGVRMSIAYGWMGHRRMWLIMTLERRHIILTALICIALLCIGTVSAKEIIVGDGSGNATITAALANASSGDIITVTDGTYSDNVVISSALNNIIIRSENGPSTTTIQSASSGSAVFYLNAAQNVTIDGFNITGSTYTLGAIYLNNADYNTLANNTINGNYMAIYLHTSCNYNIVKNNAVSSNTNYGIWADEVSNNNVFTNNTLIDSNYGLYIKESDYNVLANNTVTGNSHGIFLNSADNNNLTGNSAISNTYNGFYISSSNNNNLTGNSATGNQRGINLYTSSNYNNLTRNNANNNTITGIYLYKSDSNILTDNNANDNTGSSSTNAGVYLYDSDSNILAGNTVNNNTLYGILFDEYCCYNTLTNNTMSSNTYNLYIDIYISLTEYDHDIDTTNLVEGKPVYYLFDRTDEIVPSTAGVVYAINSSNITVTGVNISNEYYGIYLYQTENSTIENTTISDCRGGIFLSNSGNNTLIDNNASDNYYGIYLKFSSNYNTLTGNNAGDNYYGIYLYDSTSYNTLTNNIVSDNYYGIHLQNINNYNTLTDNTANNNTRGIYLRNADDIILTNNTITYSYYTGIHSYSSSDCILADNNVSYNGINTYCTGIYLDDPYNFTITNNTCYYNGYSGICLDGSGNNIVANNTAMYNDEGGIDLYYSDNNDLANNTFNNNGYGVYLWYSDANDLIHNNASNSDYGIYVEFSAGNTLTGNIMLLNDYNFQLWGSSLETYCNDVDTSNLVDSKPIYYWLNCSDQSVPDDAGTVYAINCTNVTVEDIDFANNGCGVLFAYTNNSTIKDITVSECYYGYFLYYSDNNTMRDNDISECDYGIELDYSDNNILTGNTANNNDHSGLYLCYSENNTLTDSTLSRNDQYGVYLYKSDNCSLIDNTANNNIYGFNIRYSENCSLANNIANNNAGTLQVNTMYIDENSMNNPGGSSTAYDITDNITSNAGSLQINAMSIDDISVNSQGTTGCGYYVYDCPNAGFINNQADNNTYCDLYLGSSENSSINPLILGDGLAEIDFTSNSSTVYILRTETNANEFASKTNVNGYITIDSILSSMNMSFFYSDSGMTSSKEATLTLYKLNGTEWDEVNATVDTTANTVTINLTEFGTFALFKDPEPAATTTSSSSGTRASVSQGQDPAIVGASASAVKRITGDSEVDYDFSDSGTPVLGISFDATKDKGLVVAKVQVLSSNPDGVPSPSGKSYQMLSIDVGSEGTISSDSAENIMIRFKVSKQWIEENNIDISTIRMTRYHGEQWNDLPTYQEREEDGYIYFYAETPGFSIFEVVGDEKSAISEQVPVSTPVTEEFEEPVAEEETSSTPGFTAIAGIVFVSLAVLLRRK